MNPNPGMLCTGHRLGDLLGSITVQYDGVKIGILGLVEEEWLTTLATLDPEDIEYRDFVETGRQLARELIKEGAELVIALTHMRQPNDEHLLQSVPEIDIVMGGHDHGYAVHLSEPHGNLLVKSGTDFHDLTKVEVQIDEHGKKSFQWEHLQVTGQLEEDSETKDIVNTFVASLGATMDESIGHSAVDLDGRFHIVRSQETNLGNLICDVVRELSRTEIAFLNSGTFRSDRIHPKGNFTKRDLMDILPMIDETVVLNLSGKDMLAVLENSVSQFPKLEGRFLQVSGIRFAFDPSQPAGQRIVKDSVFVPDRKGPLKMDESYRVCTKEYLATGKDGFNMLKGPEVCVDCEDSVVLPTCLCYHFMKLDVLTVWKQEVTGTTCTWVKKFAAQLKRAVADNLADKENPNVSRIAVFDDVFQGFVVAPHIENRIVQI